MTVAATEFVQDTRIPLSLHTMLESGEPSDDEATSRAGDKKSFQPYHAQSVPRLENLQAQASERAGSGTPVTTMMLRNIPNKYTQNSLLQEIDEQGFAASYNFFYLPMDVHNRSNVGYAFINFCNPKDAERFRQKFADHRFQRFQSRKISSVCAAHVQGLDENLHHFRNRAVTHARNGQYRPIVLKGNDRVDFEEALAEAQARMGVAAKEEVLEGPTLAPPPGLASGGPGTPQLMKNAAAPQCHPAAAAWARAGHVRPAGLGREGLEMAIRDLAKAIQLGQLQREGSDKKADPGTIAPPPGLSAGPAAGAPRQGLVDCPAYVPFPSSMKIAARGMGQEERKLVDLEDSCAFSRGISNFSDASTRFSFSRCVTEDERLSAAFSGESSPSR